MPAICLAQVEKRERALQPHAERRVAASHGGGGRTDPTSAQAARVRGVIVRGCWSAGYSIVSIVMACLIV